MRQVGAATANSRFRGTQARSKGAVLESYTDSMRHRGDDKHGEGLCARGHRQRRQRAADLGIPHPESVTTNATSAVPASRAAVAAGGTASVAFGPAPLPPTASPPGGNAAASRSSLQDGLRPRSVPTSTVGGGGGVGGSAMSTRSAARAVHAAAAGGDGEPSSTSSTHSPLTRPDAAPGNGISSDAAPSPAAAVPPLRRARSPSPRAHELIIERRMPLPAAALRRPPLDTLAVRLTVTSPRAGVNLMALESRLDSTCDKHERRRETERRRIVQAQLCEASRFLALCKETAQGTLTLHNRKQGIKALEVTWCSLRASPITVGSSLGQMSSTYFARNSHELLAERRKMRGTDAASLCVRV